jgi:hypothetical protein
MNQKISPEQLIKIVEDSELDPTIKSILIRDIKSEGVNDFLLEQVIAYCDKAIKDLEDHVAQQNPA